MLSLRRVSKEYPGKDAVRDLSVEVPRGEIWGFLGVNGAGKSTTMKMIAGLLKPTSGEILVDGVDVVRDPLRVKAMVGYVPDRPYLYDRLSAAEFMYFVASLYPIPKAEVPALVDRWLAEFELTEQRGHLIESFSHGMKQRLVMASVFMQSPRLLVVDEPMVGLDPRGARRLKELLRRERDERGLTVLLSTHTLDVAEEVCDQVMLIHKGELLARGSARDLRSREGERLEEVFLRLTEEEPTAQGSTAQGSTAQGSTDERP
jgi:ABC-2 type transport system ATP-binding protein